VEWRRTIALVFLAVLLPIAGYMAGQPNDQAEDEQTNSANDVGIRNGLDCRLQSENPQAKLRDRTTWLHAAVKRPEWWLVLIGFGGVWAAIRTLNAIAEQAKIMKQQYESSSRETVLLNRAYLTVGPWMEGPCSGIRFRIYNPSKTAARVEQIEFTIGAVSETKSCGFMLTPGESEWVEIQTGALPQRNVGQPTPVFTVRGRISYRDIFKRIRHRSCATVCHWELSGMTFSPSEIPGSNDEEEWDKQD
jgi:hypothetical protein